MEEGGHASALGVSFHISLQIVATLHSADEGYRMGKIR